MLHNMAFGIGAGIRRLLARSAARRLLDREDGAVMVEFALVATPFLALLVAILETSLIFFASQTLETVVADSGRFIMTGQATGMTQSDFLTKVLCKNGATKVALFDCSSLIIDVRTASSFAAASAAAPTAQQLQDHNNSVKNGTPATDPFTFDAGATASGVIVVVRLMYQWPIYVSFYTGQGLGQGMGLGRSHLIMATAAFRNEPGP